MPGLCLLLLSFTSGAQQLDQPRPNRPLRMLDSADAGTGNRLPPPQSPRRASVRQDAAERADSTPSVSSDPGIKTREREQLASSGADSVAQPPRVVDASGRQIPGAIQLGPNRVMDPRNGKIYATVPDGDGQRIVGPPGK